LSNSKAGVSFIRELFGDMRLKGDLSMDELVKSVFAVHQEDDPGNAFKKGDIKFDMPNREKAAEALIEGLNKLDRDNVGLSDAAKTKIKDIFTDESITSPEALAREFEKRENKEALVKLLHGSGADFAVALNSDQLAALKELLNKFAPGLGDMIGGLIESVVGMDHELTSTERGVRDTLVEGYNVAINGTEASFARFKGVDLEDVKNPWNGTGGGVDRQRAFFGDGLLDSSSDVAAYKFNDSYSKEYVQNFDSMIVQEWVDEGDVKFTGSEADQIAARADLVEYSAQIVIGGSLDERFAKTLEQRGIIEFSTPEARAKFIADMKEVDVNHYGAVFKEADLAKLVTDYADEHKDVILKLDNTDATEAQYSSAETALIKVLEHYVPVRDGEEYAERIADFSRDHRNIVLNYKTELASERSGPIVVANPDPEPEPAKSVKPTTKLNEWERKPTEGGEKLHVEKGKDSDRTKIGKKTAPEAFGHCARGKNAVPCRPDPDAAPENEAQPDPLEWTKTVKVDDLLPP